MGQRQSENATASSNKERHAQKKVRRFLFVHPNTVEQAQFVRLLAEQGLEVVVRDDCRQAQEYLKRNRVAGVLVVPPSGGDSSLEFLNFVRRQFPNLPTSMVLPDLQNPATALEVIARIGTAAARRRRTARSAALTGIRARQETQLESEDSRSLVLGTVQYPICFQHARFAFEREFLTAALERNGGNVTRTAEYVGMARRNLQNRMRQLGISRDQLKGKNTG